MISIRPCAIFHADFPDDQIEHGRDIIRFGGRGVTTAIAGMMADLGYSVSKPEHEGEHGWTFEVNDNGRRLGFQITNIDDDEFLLISEQAYYYEKTAGRRTPFHTEGLNHLNSALARDPRFRDIRWYLREELFAGFPGEAAPVSADSGGARHKPTPKPKPKTQPEPIFKGGFVQRLMDLILSRRKLVEVRPWAEFRADLTPEAAPYAGRETVAAIGVLLEKPDCHMTWPLPVKDKCWRLVARVRGEEVSLYVTALADRQFRLFCEPPPWVRRHFSDDYETYVRVVAHVHSALQGDTRFQDIRWSTLPGGDPGADAPM
jgi:hypothetical protein